MVLSPRPPFSLLQVLDLMVGEDGEMMARLGEAGEW